jgi:hypothetical protein
MPIKKGIYGIKPESNNVRLYRIVILNCEMKKKLSLIMSLLAGK